MTKDNILFGLIGLLVGLIIGFMVTNSMNKNALAVAPGTTASSSADPKQNSNIPAGHPDISGPGNPAVGPATGAGMQPEIQAIIDKAKQSPNDFDAQVKAAEAYYNIQRFDDAIKFLTAANKLKPDDRDVIVHLGNANFDSDNYDEAEKWYSAALAKKPDDVNVRTDFGLTFVFREPPNYDRAIQEFNKSLETDPNHPQTLQNLTVAYTKKGDSAKASATLGKLQAADPSNESIPKLKTDIEALNSK